MRTPHENTGRGRMVLTPWVLPQVVDNYDATSVSTSGGRTDEKCNFGAGGTSLIRGDGGALWWMRGRLVVPDERAGPRGRGGKLLSSEERLYSHSDYRRRQ